MDGLTTAYGLILGHLEANPVIRTIGWHDAVAVTVALFGLLAALAIVAAIKAPRVAVPVALIIFATGAFRWGVVLSNLAVIF